MQKTFHTPGPVSLYVEIGSGGIILHTDDVSETEVDVEGKNAEDVVVEQRGDEIVILARQRGTFLGRSHDIDVHVSLPHDSRLTTKLGSADLKVTGRLGDVALKTGSGDIELEDVSGEGYVESGSGDLRADTVRGDLRIRSGSGDITIDELGGETSISTGSGDVEVGTARRGVHVKSGSGDLRVGESLEGVELSTASGDLVVERVHRGQLTAKNVSGDIRVGIPLGVPVWTDISTMTGNLRSSLEGAGEPADGQDYIELRAKTVSGDIVLEQIG